MKPEINSFLIKAHQHYEAGEWVAAIHFYEHVLTLEPDSIDSNLHAHLAHAYKKTHAIANAITHYQQAIALDPKHAQAHNNLASLYSSKNEYQLALKHYCNAVHAAPDFTVAHYNLGLLFLKHHEFVAAQKQFNNVLALSPEHIDAAFYLGTLKLEDNALDEAQQHFLYALSLNPEHIDSLVNLGVIALKQQQSQQAIDYFTQALALDESHLEARNNLAATFMHYDRFENALMYYDALIQQDPLNIEYHYNSGVAQMALGHLDKATTHFESILTQNEHHFAALNNLAAIHMRLGHRELAIDLLKRAILANPSDQSSGFMLNALMGQEKNPAACTDYVNNLFNNYAIHYEQHMQDVLHYTLPQQIGALLHQLNVHAIKHALDLGCGTGLSGIVLREASAHLTGVDIAEKMLAQAREKGIYDQLIETEIVSFLQHDQIHYELIVAADVLPYFGDLSALFNTINQRLTPAGLFIFSSEISQDTEWHLQESIRFCHHPDYIRALCVEHGLQLIHQEQKVARQQEQQNLNIMLYAARKT